MACKTKKFDYQAGPLLKKFATPCIRLCLSSLCVLMFYGSLSLGKEIEVRKTEERATMTIQLLQAVQLEMNQVS